MRSENLRCRRTCRSRANRSLRRKLAGMNNPGCAAFDSREQRYLNCPRDRRISPGWQEHFYRAAFSCLHVREFCVNGAPASIARTAIPFTLMDICSLSERIDKRANQIFKAAERAPSAVPGLGPDAGASETEAARGRGLLATAQSPGPKTCPRAHR